jgi:ADP-ribose pyrophosphatase
LTSEKTLTSQIIYDGRVVKLRVDTVQTADGRQTTREIVEHADCVAVVAVDADDNVLLVNQFRKPVERELLEIPAGGIDAGEDAETAVRRELQEEIGYLPQESRG